MRRASSVHCPCSYTLWYLKVRCQPEIGPMPFWKQSHRRPSRRVSAREWFRTRWRELHQWVRYVTGRSGRVWGGSSSRGLVKG